MGIKKLNNERRIKKFTYPDQLSECYLHLKQKYLHIKTEPFQISYGLL